MSVHTPPMFSSPHILDNQRWKNRRVGLLGGSFNPPHEGHVHISMAALAGLHLDYVWWLVTPQNPNKTLEPAPMDERMDQCRALTTHPKIIVTDIEQSLRTTITFDTIKKMKTYFPTTKFIWISGMDNALGLHKWNHWQDLLKEIPMVHFSRNPARSMIQACPLRMYKKQKHVVLNKGGKVPLDSGVSYWMMQQKIVHASSSEIRKNGKKSTG